MNPSSFTVLNAFEQKNNTFVNDGIVDQISSWFYEEYYT